MDQDAKKAAAAEVALEYVEPGSVIGVGTGSTANLFIDGLGRMKERIRGAVASSLASSRRLAEYGIPVIELAEAGTLSVYVDGADESTRERYLIKGGGGALTREKIVAESSLRFVCVVDDSKLVERLGAFPLPIEVVTMAVSLVTRELELLGGRVVPRKGFVTDNGQSILDVHGLTIENPVELESRLNQIPGVVTNGLFCRRPADLLIVAGDAGIQRFED